MNVRFALEGGGGAGVEVEGVDGPQTCTSPCSLSLSPGTLRLVVGEARIDTKITIPRSGATVRLAAASGGRDIGWGVAFLVLGVGGMGSFYVLSSGFSNIDIVPVVIGALGVGLTILGVLKIIAGATAKGSARVLSRDDDEQANASAFRLRFVDAGVQLTPGGAMAGAVLSF